MDLKNNKLEKKDEIIDLENEDINFKMEDMSIEVKGNIENKIETLDLEPENFKSTSNVDSKGNDDIEELNDDTTSENINEADNYNSNSYGKNISDDNSSIPKEDTTPALKSDEDKQILDDNPENTTEKKDSQSSDDENEQSDSNKEKNKSDNKTDDNKENNNLGKKTEDNKENNNQGNKPENNKENNNLGNKPENNKENNNLGNNLENNKENNNLGNKPENNKENNNLGNNLENNKENNNQGNKPENNKDNNNSGNNLENNKENSNLGNKSENNKENPKDKSAIDNKREQAKHQNENNKRKSPNKSNNGSNLKDKLKNKAKNKAKDMAKNAADNAKNKALDSFNNSGLGQTVNNVKDKVDKAKKAVNTAKKTAKAAKTTVAMVKLIIGALVAAWPIVLGVLCIIIVIVCIAGILGVDANAGTYSGYSNYTGGYYCTNITVDGKSYPLEEYVARVIAQELGMADAEGLKAQAVLARTFVLNRTADGNCSISNSQNEQTLKIGDIDQKYYDAANATEGIILTSGGKITGAYYATFPTGEEGSQDWGEGGCGPITCDDKGNCTTKYYKYPSKTPWNFTMPNTDSSGNYWNGSSLTNQYGHCHGVSQLGILYYEEQGKKYDEILKIFYDSTVELSKLPTETQTGTAIIYSGAGSYRKKMHYYNQIDYNTTGYCGRTPAPPSKQYLKDLNCKDNTICSSGCGGTSLAMVVASIKQDSTITPVTIMSSIQERGGCGVGVSGSYIQPMVNAAKEVYGLTAYSTYDSNDVAEKLASGDYLVIANVGESEFSSGGHYIVLSGYENGKVHVLDPWGGAKTDMPNSAFLSSSISKKTRNGWWEQSAVFDYITYGYIVIGENTEQ